KAHEAFNEDGSLKDKKQEDQVKKIGANVAKMLLKLNGQNQNKKSMSNLTIFQQLNNTRS
ncbi:MAG TPA: hypothetical protein VKB83_02655, partial [Nitrosopumilaceae archaeon]|nr:hypothetical protein [Nitrosopumilaceae archaeon]